MALSFLVLSLSACSQKPIATSNQTIVVVPPNSLLIDPCKAVPAGESLIDLAKSYNSNVGCIGMYKKQMQKIRDNKAKQEALYNVK